MSAGRDSQGGLLPHKMPGGDLTIATRALCGLRQSCVRAKKSGSDFPFRYCPLTGTAKYAVLTPFASIALPVISPLSFMSLAVSPLAEKLPFSSLRSVGILPCSKITARVSTPSASDETRLLGHAH